MRKGRILVAEDDRTARVSLVGLLEAEGFVVSSAETGTEAQSLLMEELNVAVLDIRMPGLDGLTILQRTREGGLGTPVILMTAHGNSNTAIEAMKAGAFDYILEPSTTSYYHRSREPSSIGVWLWNSSLFAVRLPLMELRRQWSDAVQQCRMSTS